jgi:hypothetical protein
LQYALERRLEILSESRGRSCDRFLDARFHDAGTCARGGVVLDEGDVDSLLRRYGHEFPHRVSDLLVLRLILPDCCISESVVDSHP